LAAHFHRWEIAVNWSKRMNEKVQLKVVFLGGGSFRILPIVRGAFLHKGGIYLSQVDPIYGYALSLVFDPLYF